jgi:type IV pilus assembly protein PilE
MKRAKGFSLIELLVAVAIVAILASVAMPAYRDYVTRGKLTEAHTTLAAQRVRMEQFYQDMRTYDGACAAGTVAPEPTGKHFDFKCEIADQTYIVRATGKSGDSVAGFEFTVDQNNNRATVAAPTGWTVNGTCWIRNKAGEC